MRSAIVRRCHAVILDTRFFLRPNVAPELAFNGRSYPFQFYDFEIDLLLRYRHAVRRHSDYVCLQGLSRLSKAIICMEADIYAGGMRDDMNSPANGLPA